MAGYEVVTQDLREEAKLWQEKADRAEPVVQAVRDTHLSAPAFFVGDLATLGAGMVNAAFEASQYEQFRAFIEKCVTGAVTEFNQIDGVLRKIADEYDRTESVNEIELREFYG
ncbi:hypothetical protein [Lentzea albidocapillata]|uniref:Excreted virulence factor EspC, type VII ESX diderm n=1 Tax=Lentzea albidocapillata TaxID=40571 RepID=A0A1W2EG65_9PSEU|nr:hypothetical protein [Lentzea albidocapillata]SMD08422.1 hypothetical protein SAMN05660733_04022 [Lentzea albidocapillata]